MSLARIEAFVQKYETEISKLAGIVKILSSILVEHYSGLVISQIHIANLLPFRDNANSHKNEFLYRKT